MNKEVFFSKLKNKCLGDEEIQRTKEIITRIDIKNGEDLTQLCLNSDVFLLADVFKKVFRISIEDYGNTSLNFVSLPVYTWRCGLNYTNIKLQALQGNDLILTLEENLCGGIGSIMGDRYIQ